MRALLMAIILLAPAQTISAQAGGKPLAPISRLRSEVNLFIELHNHLQAESRTVDDLLPEYRTELKAYRDAKELAKDPLVWQIVNDACIAGPDIATIGKVTGRLPASLTEADKEAVRKLIGALESAWPRFAPREGVERRRSLQAAWSRVLVKHWRLIEERLLTTLYEKFAFQPIDAAITVYPVIEAVQLGSWGRTDKGYYIIIPVARMTNLVIIEQMLHEVTHVVGDRQPAGSDSLLRRLARQASGADKESFDRFVEGLVAWNAGELIRRFVSADYKPIVEVSPGMRSPVEPYLPTYQGPWVAYLEGKISADDVIKGMVSALKPAAAPPEKG